MQKLKTGLFLIIVSLIGWGSTGCKDKQTFLNIDTDNGADYYPLAIGKYMTYAVDSVYYTSDNPADTVRLQVREEITDTLTDNEGDLIYRVERMERNSPADSWVIKQVLAVKRTSTQAQRVENNQRFISLTFPPGRNAVWEGIGFNSDSLEIAVRGEVIKVFKDWQSQYETINEPFLLDDFQFDSTLVVTHANNENFIELRVNREIYAKNIGLVFKEMSILDTQLATSVRTWPDDAERGFTMVQTLIDHN